MDSEWLRRLGGSLIRLGSHQLVSALEPDKDNFRVRRGQVGAITKMLRALQHDEVRPLRTAKGRDDFLYATKRHLEQIHSHEELIVAFGRRRGRARHAGAQIEFLYRAVGQSDRVSITGKLLRLLETQLTRERGEVVLVHNHPPNPLKTVMREIGGGWKPLPSGADRNIATALLTSRIGHLLSSDSPASFKWYLVDEGRMSEFLAPSPDRLLDALGVPK